MTNLLSPMEKTGLIRREGSEEDRRILRVYITPKGRKAFERSEAAFSAVEDQCFRGFSPHEKAEAIAYLKRINANLKS